MPTIKETVHLPISPDEAWRRFGGFGDIERWHPMLHAVESEGETPGARRIAPAKDGSMQIERLSDYDATAHVYRYRMEDTSMPVKNYEAEFAMTGEDDGSTVRWTATFDVAGEDNGEAWTTVQGFLRAGLDALLEAA